MERRRRPLDTEQYHCRTQHIPASLIDNLRSQLMSYASTYRFWRK